MYPLQIGIAGAGRIAREQHIPAIRANPAFELAGCSNADGPVEGVPTFVDTAAMLEACPNLSAVAVCSPPQTHFEVARLALERGKHVLLEKPPCSTVQELDELVALARRKDRTLFQSWHSCHAAAIAEAEKLFATRRVRRARVVWREDIEQCHPGQGWLWEPGGFGVLDAGINALSILSRVLPEPIFVRSAKLYFPENCQTPVRAEVRLELRSGSPIETEFDFGHHGPSVWDMHVATDRGDIGLGDYGNSLNIDGAPVAIDPGPGEYPSLYRQFAQLIREQKSEVDSRAFRLTADIFLVGRRLIVPPLDFVP